MQRTHMCAALVLLAVVACARSGALPGAAPGAPITDASTAGAAQRGAPGSLRQEDVTLRLQLTGVLAQVTPLDTTVIRLLAPDSYRSLMERLASQRARIDSARRTHGVERFSVWNIAYYGLEPDARFSPGEVVFSAAGRDFRPLEIIPLTPGFNRHTIGQRQTHIALYLFDSALDVNQPLEVRIEGAVNAEWSAVLRTIESERTRVRAGRVDTAVSHKASE